MNPKDDSTSIGAILVSMGSITGDQLNEVVETQKQMREDTLLGVLLVHNELCSKEQLEAAIDVQVDMRSKNKPRRALAFANVALRRSLSTESYKGVVDQINRVAKKVETSSFHMAKVISSKNEDNR